VQAGIISEVAGQLRSELEREERERVKKDSKKADAFG
jgi:hypothetical protein